MEKSEYFCILIYSLIYSITAKEYCRYLHRFGDPVGALGPHNHLVLPQGAAARQAEGGHPGNK